MRGVLAAIVLATSCAGASRDSSGARAAGAPERGESGGVSQVGGGERGGQGLEEHHFERAEMVLYGLHQAIGDRADVHAIGLQHDASAREHFRERRFGAAATEFVRAASAFRQLDAAGQQHQVSCMNAGVSWYNAEMESDARDAAHHLESEDPTCASHIRQTFE
jgi:hypothetical protein